MPKSASEEIAARKAKYSSLEFAVDALGRNIGVSRLRPSEQVRIQEWTPGLSGTTTVINDDPESENFQKSFEISQRAPLIIAASVRVIDDAKYTFPKSRADLDSIFDRLDDEGIVAAGEALSKFNTAKEEESAETKSVEEAAKN